jgi:hypothetical protein
MLYPHIYAVASDTWPYTLGGVRRPALWAGRALGGDGDRTGPSSGALRACPLRGPHPLRGGGERLVRRPRPGLARRAAGHRERQVLLHRASSFPGRRNRGAAALPRLRRLGRARPHPHHGSASGRAVAPAGSGRARGSRGGTDGGPSTGKRGPPGRDPPAATRRRRPANSRGGHHRGERHRERGRSRLRLSEKDL